MLGIYFGSKLLNQSIHVGVMDLIAIVACFDFQKGALVAFLKERFVGFFKSRRIFFISLFGAVELEYFFIIVEVGDKAVFYQNLLELFP